MARIKMGAEAAPAPAAPDSERSAIQAEALLAEKAIQDRMNAALEVTRARLAESKAADAPRAVNAEAQKALGAGFFGNPPAPAPASAPASPVILEPAGAVSAVPPAVFNVGIGDDSEEVTAVHGEELYGKQGTFSQYRVGPFTGRTKVRVGETHADALRRLKAQLRAEADEERVAAHDRFMAHWKKNIANA